MLASVPNQEARLGTRQFSGTSSDNITLSEMTNTIPNPPVTGLPTVTDHAGDRARAYVRASRAENTRRAYAADWRNFTAWAATASLTPLPATPETVGLYLAAEAARLRPGTLARHLVAITAAHRAAGYQFDTRAPQIRETLTGIKRTHGTHQATKAPAVVADLKAMIEAQPGTLAGLRDCALLLLGFAGALRRSELSSLNVEDLEFTSEGLVVIFRRSKTDQDGRGRQIGVPYGSRRKTCPVRTIEEWLKASGITSVAVFREITRSDRLATAYVDKSGRQRGLRLSDKSVALVVKRAAKAAGLDAKIGMLATLCEPVLRLRRRQQERLNGRSWPPPATGPSRWSWWYIPPVNCFEKRRFCPWPLISDISRGRACENPVPACSQDHQRQNGTAFQGTPCPRWAGLPSRRRRCRPRLSVAFWTSCQTDDVYYDDSLFQLFIAGVSADEMPVSIGALADAVQQT